MKHQHLETKLIHAGEPDPLICGAVSLPIFQSSTFEVSCEPGYYDLKYIRLITRPAATTHAGVSPEERQAMGISDGLIRLSVGLENTQDMIEDFERALEKSV